MQLSEIPRPKLEAVRRSLAPYFANDAQERFWASKSPELLYSGAMGAGKSRILTEKAWRIAKRYPGVTVGIFRKVAASLPATTLRTFTRDVMERHLIAARNKTEGWFELHNGSRIYFLGLDPDPLTGVPSKVGSLDLGWAGVDEAIELTEADWIMLIGRLRDPRIAWHQLAAATNPGPPNHWLKRRFGNGMEGREYVHATAQDNIFLPDDYKKAVGDLPDNAIGRRLGRGEWVAAEGQIWSVPDEQVRDPFEQRWHRSIAGIDWGFQHAFACEVIVETSLGARHVVDEVYEKQRTPAQLMPLLHGVMAKWKVDHFYADPSQPGYIVDCQSAGLPVTAATNDVLPGITAVSEEIARGLTVSPRCGGLLSELPGYVWKMQRASGQPVDEPVKLNDDACDALRYAVMGLRTGWQGASDVAVA